MHAAGGAVLVGAVQHIGAKVCFAVLDALPHGWQSAATRGPRSSMQLRSPWLASASLTGRRTTHATKPELAARGRACPA